MEELLRTLPEPFNRAVVMYQRGTLEILRAKMDQAVTTIDHCLLACVDAGLPESRNLAVIGGLMFAMHHQQGRLHELGPMARPLLVDQPCIPAWRSAVAMVAAEAGDDDEISTQVDALSPDGFAVFHEDFIWTGGMTGLGVAVATTGDVDRCRLVYDRLQGHSGLLSWLGSGSFGPVDQALGDLALVSIGADEAEGHYRIAQQISIDWAAPGYLSWAECGLARVHLAREEPDQARALLETAGDRARALGLAGVLISIDRVLSAMGLPAHGPHSLRAG